MPEAKPTPDVAALTVQLLSAYLTNNTVPSEDLAGLIRSTRDALTQGALTRAQEEPETFTPAVSARKSLASPDHIISLIDGKPYKTLKRHLMGHGLTPEAYRSRYNLPANYPMVAPLYAEHRRDIARKAGLGSRKPTVEVAAVPQVDAPLSPEATRPPSVPADMGETSPPASKKKSKAPSKPKAPAVDKPTLELVTPTSDTGQAPAAEHDASPATPTQQSSQDDPAAAASERRAPSPAKKPRVKASPAKPPKRRTGKPKQAVADEPAPFSQTSSEGSGEPSEEQNTQAAAPKPKRRAKLGLFGDAKAKSDESANGSDAQSPSAPQNAASDEASAKAPVKRKSFKRMARGSDTSLEAQGTGPNNEL